MIQSPDSPKFRELAIMRLVEDIDRDAQRQAKKTEQKVLYDHIYVYPGVAKKVLGKDCDMGELHMEYDLYCVIHAFANDIYGAVPNYEHTVDRILTDYAEEDLWHLTSLAMLSGSTIAHLLLHDWRTYNGP